MTSRRAQSSTHGRPRAGRRLRRLLGLAAIGGAAAAMIEQRLADRAAAAGDGGGAIESRVEIEAPLALVWAGLADIPGQVRWMKEMKSVRILTPGPTRVGTRGEATVRIFGISVTDPVEIVEWDPPRAFAIRHDGRFGGGGRLTLALGLDGTDDRHVARDTRATDSAAPGLTDSTARARMDLPG
jgi:Polyketide cyclase / dehydrase and lipid transport